MANIGKGMMDRRGFLRSLPLVVVAPKIIGAEDKETGEIVFKMPVNIKEFNGGSHNYLMKDGSKSELFLPEGIWRMTEVRFIKA